MPDAAMLATHGVGTVAVAVDKSNTLRGRRHHRNI
jgi:hypothetical protein